MDNIPFTIVLYNYVRDVFVTATGDEYPKTFYKEHFNEEYEKIQEKINKFLADSIVDRETLMNKKVEICEFLEKHDFPWFYNDYGEVLIEQVYAYMNLYSDHNLTINDRGKIPLMDFKIPINDVLEYYCDPMNLIVIVFTNRAQVTYYEIEFFKNEYFPKKRIKAAMIRSVAISELDEMFKYKLYHEIMNEYDMESSYVSDNIINTPNKYEKLTFVEKIKFLFNLTLPEWFLGIPVIEFKSPYWPSH